MSIDVINEFLLRNNVSRVLVSGLLVELAILWLWQVFPVCSPAQ
jgi:hypothetical protein